MWVTIKTTADIMINCESQYELSLEDKNRILFDVEQTLNNKMATLPKLPDGTQAHMRVHIHEHDD